MHVNQYCLMDAISVCLHYVHTCLNPKMHIIGKIFLVLLCKSNARCLFPIECMKRGYDISSRARARVCIHARMCSHVYYDRYFN